MAIDISDPGQLLSRRRALGLMAAVPALAGPWGSPAFAQDSYPDKVVRIVVGWAPGTPPEVMARLIGDHFTKVFKQPFIVESRPGAGSTIAGALVARAQPDGYTLMLGVASGLATAPHLIPTAGYDPRTAFEPIGFVQRGPYYFSVASQLPIHDLKSLVTYSKSAEKPLVFGSLGIGSVHHLIWELLMAETGIRLTHVPFGGTPQMVNEALAGRVDLMLEAASTLTAPHAKAGKIRYIATTGPTRSTAYPNVATVAEQGLPALQSSSWWVLVGPKGLPPAIVAKLNAELARALATPEARQLLNSIGAFDAGQPSPPREVGELIASEYVRWGNVITKANVKLGG